MKIQDEFEDALRLEREYYELVDLLNELYNSRLDAKVLVSILEDNKDLFLEDENE